MSSASRTVMVIEDDEAIRLVLRTFLEEEGYRVVEAVTGEQGLVIVQDEQPDVVLVDLRLPGIHGFDVIRSLRGQSAGLEAGADDYVTKPFVAKELSARIRSQLRRTTATEEEPATLVCGPIEVHPDTAEVMLNGEPILLSRIEFRVLQELVLARGRVLSRDELLRRVWGYGNAGDGRVVDNLIYRLRSKIEIDPANPTHLVTVRGFGYRLKD